MNRTQNSRQCDYVQVSCLFGRSLALKGFICKFDWNCTLLILHKWRILSNKYCSYSKWTDRCTSPSMLKIVSGWNHLHIVHCGSIEFQECSFQIACFYWNRCFSFVLFLTECWRIFVLSVQIVRFHFTAHDSRYPMWLHKPFVLKFAYSLQIRLFLYPSQHNLQCPNGWVKTHFLVSLLALSFIV